MTAPTFFAFRSGMSHKSDLRGGMDAGVPVGVVASALTIQQSAVGLPRYLDQGGRVFIDSGAFTAFQTGASLDYCKVMRVYERVVESTRCPQNLWVVSPDVVGAQDKTLVLIEEWKTRIVQLIEDGCNVIVPLQCGLLPGQTMIETVTRILGTHRWVAGIPSNKAAMSIAECETLCHGAFHILGRVKLDSQQALRIGALRNLNPQAAITADANWLRSRLLTVLKGTKVHQDSRRGRSLTPAEQIDHSRVNAVVLAIRADQDWGQLATSLA